jgi:hypothetical protein
MMRPVVAPKFGRTRPLAWHPREVDFPRVKLSDGRGEFSHALVTHAGAVFGAKTAASAWAGLRPTAGRACAAREPPRARAPQFAKPSRRALMGADGGRGGAPNVEPGKAPPYGFQNAARISG